MTRMFRRVRHVAAPERSLPSPIAFCSTLKRAWKALMMILFSGLDDGLNASWIVHIINLSWLSFRETSFIWCRRPIQCDSTGAGNPLCPHLKLYYIPTGGHPVPVNSELWLKTTSWLIQNLSSIFLKLLTELASTTLFQILTTREQKEYLRIL